MSYDISKYIELIRSRDIDGAEEYRINHVPKRLFKYVYLHNDRSCEFTSSDCRFPENENEKRFSSLENGRIWLSRYSNLNDPFELRATYLDKERLCKTDWPMDLLEDTLERLRNFQLITCFSDAVVDNMPMWAHYANNHSGFCIEYEVVEGRYIHPVSYESQRVGIAFLITQVLTLGAEINEGIRDVNDDEYNYYMQLFFAQTMMKHKSWSYEKEYRAFFSDYNFESNGYLANISDLGLNVKAIYVGASCSSKNYERLKLISGKLKVSIYRMELDDQSPEFCLMFTEV